MINHKLLVTIVKKGLSQKVINASKQAGAEGGTTIPGKGTGLAQKNFLGFCIEPEKEIILTLISKEVMNGALEAIARSAELDKTGNGIAFVIDVCQVIGIAHLTEACELSCSAGGCMSNTGYELIVTVVNKGNAEIVVDATKRAGAQGGTIIYGRGTGIHEQAKLFSIAIEPEKELVLTLIERARVQDVLSAIQEDVAINEPGRGISFVLPVEQTMGIKSYAATQSAPECNGSE